MFHHWIWAQTSDPSGVGLTGWSGFGIVGLILGWLLLHHLPRILNEAREDRKLFKDSLDAVLQHCKEERVVDKQETKEMHNHLIKQIEELSDKTESIERRIEMFHPPGSHRKAP